MVQVLEEACHMVLELAILVDAPQEARIHRLATRVHEAWEVMTKLQLELNLQTTELWLKAHPSTPQEVWEKCVNAIIAGMEEINNAVRDYTKMLEESFEVLTGLLEDPKI